MVRQSVDSCVVPEYQGLLIFPEMIQLLLDSIESSIPVFGFPNHNSFPISKILRHKIIGIYRTRLFTSLKKYLQENSAIIPYAYAKWWLVFSNKEQHIYFLRKNNHFFLVRKTKKKSILRIIGEVEESTATLFPKINNTLVILSYGSIYPTFYNKKKTGTVIISQQNSNIHVPLWSVDAI